MIIDITLNHFNATLPSYAYSSDGAVDLTAATMSKNSENNTIIYDTGLSMAIPEGYVGLLLPRSSVVNKDLRLSNSVGVLDSSFRGTVKLVFDQLPGGTRIYNPGDRVGQLLIIPRPSIVFRQVEKLSETLRNKGGFGSTGF